MYDDKWCKCCGQPIPKRLIHSWFGFLIVGIIIGVIDIVIIVMTQEYAANGQCDPEWAIKCWFVVPIISLLIWFLTPFMTYTDDSGWAERDK